MQYLLLISCSQRKVESAEPLPAIDRYDGPTYRCLRKMRRASGIPSALDIRIISAKYGLIHSHKPIGFYDQPMTPERADELRPHIQDELQLLVTISKSYDQVFINLGKTYMRTLDGFHWRFISTMEASGGIGQRTSQMKVWLERIHKESGGN